MSLTSSLRSLRSIRVIFRAAACAILSPVFTGASQAATEPAAAPIELKVSVKDQKLALYYRGQPVRVYGISTSKFGVGDSSRSYCTPAGKLTVADKIGGGQPAGMVFKGRQATGEVLPPNAPGRDPIVSRILWLNGQEAGNGNAYGRCIYIHGTPEERNIGRPSSFGCIRMRSMDVIDLYSRVGVGTQVTVTADSLPREAKRLKEFVYQPPARPVNPYQSAGQTSAAFVRNAPAQSKAAPLAQDRKPQTKAVPYAGYYRPA